MTAPHADRLRQIVEQIEAGEAEKADAAERIKDFYACAKADGYDTKVLRKVIARRKRARDELAEEEAILEVYEAALNGDT